MHYCLFVVYMSINIHCLCNPRSKFYAAHTCVRQQRDLPLIHSGFLAEKYESEFRINPNWPITAFHKRVLMDIQVDFNPNVLRRARRKCMKNIKGIDADQYAKLWDYRMELLQRQCGNQRQAHSQRW
mgnify:CR=1 FL=1